MPIHMLVTVYSVEGIGWKPTFRVGTPPKFYLEVVPGSQPPVTSKEVEIVDDVCTWKEKLPLVITGLDDTLQFRLRRHARARTDPTFGSLDITAKELIEQSSGDSQGIRKDLQREKGKARPNVPFVIQLSAQETDADGNAKTALDNALKDVADNNVGSGSDAVDKIETDPALLLVQHLSTLSDKLGVMDVITDKVDSLAELHPYAKIAWTVCSSLYQAVKKQRLTDSNLVSLVKTMSDTYSKVDELKDIPDKIKSLEAVIALILQQISECSLFVREYIYRDFTGRILEQNWKDQSSKVHNFIAGFESLKKDLDGATIRTGVLVISRINENVTQLLESDYIKSLRPSEMNRANRKLCLPGTRKKILDEITEKILLPIRNTGQAKKNIFWLHGMAGSGKSTVANTISHRFDRLGRRGAYLFFERSKSDPTTVIRTIAHQLALFDSTLCTEICASIRAKPSIVDESLQDQFNQLLLQPLRAAARKLSAPIVVVLDALDECGDEETRASLLEILKNGLPDLPDVFHFLITSRPELDIRSQLTSVSLELEMEIASGEQEKYSDVRMYFSSVLEEIRRRKQLPEGWPGQDKTDLLVQSSEGLFIWASSACQLIRRTPVDGLDNFFSKASGIQGLDNLYATALESSYEWGSANTVSWSHFQSVMATVLFSHINLDDATVDRMLGLSGESSSRFVMSCFPALLDYTPGHPIRPLHASFRDYLVNEGRSGGRAWSLSSIDPERQLAECCFRVMSNQLCFNIYGIKTSHKSDREYFTRSNTKDAISQELKYSCQYWGKHLKAAHTLDNRLVSLLETFSYQEFLFWFEVMQVSGLWSEARDACKEIAKHIRTFSMEMGNFWDDAYHFISGQKWAITSHIYLSTLPLTPPTSKISQIYLPKFPNTLKVIFQQTSSPPDHTPSTGYLLHLGFSPDGTMLISCFGNYEECTVHIRSTQDYSLLPQYQACHHPDGIFVAKFSHDNHFLYCLTLKCALVSWESATGEFTEIHPTGVSDFDIYGEKIIACCKDGNLRIWAREEPKVTGPDFIYIGDESLRFITVSPSGLCAVLQRGAVHLVDSTLHSILREIPLEIDESINSLSFSDTGVSLAAGISDDQYQIFLCSQSNDWEATAQRKKISNSLWGRTVAWLKEKPIVCIGWDDGTASLWNVKTQSIISGSLCHRKGDCQVAISPDGKTLATGTYEECIKIWDVEMLLGQGESVTGDPFQILKAENPQLFDGCKYERGWIVGSGDERLLWVPLKRFEGNPALKYTTIPGAITELDFSKFVYGEEWAECYSG